MAASARRFALATRRSLSAVAKGDKYEAACHGWLGRLLVDVDGDVRRSGERGDLGRDLVGSLPTPRGQARLVGQCKATRAPVGPGVLRELEGALARDATVDTPALGVLFAIAGFSKGTLRGARASSRPLLLVHLTSARALADSAQADLLGDDADTPTLVSALENPAARQLLGDMLRVLHMPSGPHIVLSPPVKQS